MQNKIKSLNHLFNEELENCRHTKEIERLRVKYLGKKSSIQSLMKELRKCDQAERPHIGKEINILKEHIASALETKSQEIQEEELTLRLEKEKIDVTMPGRRRFFGRIHPLSQILEEVIEILAGMGFSFQASPEIETEYYNYGGLNYSVDHPARDMQDTLYLSENVMLRSHTTAIQQHVMENTLPPIRIIAAGKCYRNETITARSHVFFHQVDGLYIDKKVNFGDLLATMKEFYTKVFKRSVEMRIRPSYFPFVEPGMEIDLKCIICSGKGCALCKQTSWVEVCGAGMVHPRVLKAGGIDPEIYSGYAWGGGIERLLMLRSRIDDIRLFTENDLRFLEQFTA